MGLFDGMGYGRYVAITTEKAVSLQVGINGTGLRVFNFSGDSGGGLISEVDIAICT